jgi:hypothetical protein
MSLISAGIIWVIAAKECVISKNFVGGFCTI